MLNVLTAEATGIDLQTFLGYGTELLTWIGTSMTTLLDTLMGHPVTATFLIVSLVYVVVSFVGRFTR